MSRLISTSKNWFINQIARGLAVIYHWLYTTFAWTYDLVAGFVSLGRWQNWVLAILPPALQSPALELGFGPGHLLEAIGKIKVDVYGIDLSRQMCSLAQKRIRKSGGVPNIARARADGIPFKNESISTVFSTFPAPYIFSKATAEEINRVLKTDGVLVVLLSVQMNGSSLPERMMRSLFRWTGLHQINQPMIENLFSAYLSVGLEPRLEVQPCGSDALLKVVMKKDRFLIQ